MRVEHDQDPLNTLPDSADIPDLRESIQDTADKLKTLSGKLRVKLHLAGMEVKDMKTDLAETVDGLSRRLHDYAGSLEKTKETAEVQLHLGLMDAKKHWEVTKEQADHALKLIKEDKEKAKAFLQDIRVQAKLAKAETSDSLHETKEELSQNFKEISRQGSSAIKRMNRSVGEFLHSLS